MTVVLIGHCWCHENLHSLDRTADRCSVVQVVWEHTLDRWLHLEDGSSTHALDREAYRCEIEVAREYFLADHFYDFSTWASQPFCDFLVSKRKSTFLVRLLSFVIVIAVEVFERFGGFYEGPLLCHAAFTIILACAISILFLNLFGNLFHFFVRSVFRGRIALLKMTLLSRGYARWAIFWLFLGRCTGILQFFSPFFHFFKFLIS